MVVKRIEPFSLAKLMGVLYAGIGLIIGVVVALIAMAGMSMGAALEQEGSAMAPLFGAVFGVGAIVFLPILYGIFGFIGGLIGSFLYNVAAGIVGGLEIDVS
jgi:hypothetical protein